VDIEDHNGETPLWLAVLENKENAALLLVRHGANLEHETNDKKTVLEIASPELRDKLISTSKSMRME